MLNQIRWYTPIDKAEDATQANYNKMSNHEQYIVLMELIFYRIAT